MKRLRVELTAGAARDLEGIARYLADRDSTAAARKVLGAFANAMESLGEFPDRGRHPPELATLGISRYRELVLPPYRVICRVGSGTVYIAVIADARRDMQALLARRLLGG